ncbi:MAG: carboxylating nicotinate-nucleotide diphosphorylase [Calditrichaeota bacterium]|nr:MAG: carboxylating nicotinate-nucleotide diphosphorylase [Calditrichota bacterium]
MHTVSLNWKVVDELIDRALREDVGSGDVTTEALFSPAERARAYFLAKQAGVIAGLPLAERVFRRLDAGIRFTLLVEEGERVSPHTRLANLEGSCRTILTGERLALNILQHLSGIATLTAAFVEAVAGLPVKILDTRKTHPGLRVFEKYAVAVGGGVNHRMGLYDGVMIKDNHIQLAGSITAAVERIRRVHGDKFPIEVEAATLPEVEEALRAGADIIMLDNMDVETMRQAVKMIGGRAKTEASGGITLERVRAIAETGVDMISVGALTHSARALDISLYID